jgi:hypothetical protein
MELTIEQARELRKYRHSDKESFKAVIYPCYNTITGELVKIFNDAREAYKYSEGRNCLYSVNITSSIHCPRSIYLQLTPEAQLDFFLDGYLEDEVTKRHAELRGYVLEREGKRFKNNY